MCDLCGDEDRVIIDIRNVHEKSVLKYESGVAALTKAFGYDSERQQAEISPFKSVRDLESISKDWVEHHLVRLYNAMTRWFEVGKSKSDPFVLNGRIFINPKTGRALTKAQWAAIKKDILRAFDYIYAGEEERIATHALSLGKVLKGMSLADSISMGYTSLQDQVKDTIGKLTGPLWSNQVDFAQQHAAEMIVDLKQNQYRKIHDTILTGIKNRQSHRELRESLFDKFGDMNRDWRRIAETEIGNSMNNGQLLTEIERKRDGERVFMRGVSASGACPWCRSQVNEKIVVLLEDPPDTGDTVIVDGTQYTAIWPGKDNYGRRRADWWVSAGVQHPHCVPSGQLVSTSALGAVTKAFYEGYVVEIRTSSGNRITVTENHPVLTPDGFVPAKFLNQRGYVFVSPDPDRLHQTVNPNDYQRPTLVENLFASLRHSSGVPSPVMEVSDEDFYGDGRFFDGNVDVVFPNRFLWDHFKTVFFEDLYKVLLSRTLILNSRFFLSEFGTTFKLLQRYGLSSASILRLLDHLITLALTHFTESDLVRLFTASDVDSKFTQSVVEGVPTHSQLSSEFVHRFSGDVPFNHAVRKRPISNSTGFVVPSRITGLSRTRFSGHVYDLQDDMHGLYTCNGVLVKNCRCTWVKYVPGFEDIEAKFREAMNAAMAGGK